MAKRMRIIAMAAIWLSLLAPWYPYSDGGASPGWLTLIAAFVPTSTLWLVHHLALVSLTATLVVATLTPSPSATPSLSRSTGPGDPQPLQSASTTA